MSISAWEFRFDPASLPQPVARTVSFPLLQSTAATTPAGPTIGQLWPRATGGQTVVSATPSGVSEVVGVAASAPQAGSASDSVSAAPGTTTETTTVTLT